MLKLTNHALRLSSASGRKAQKTADGEFGNAVRSILGIDLVFSTMLINSSLFGIRQALFDVFAASAARSFAAAG